MTPYVEVFIGLGSNIHPARHLSFALKMLASSLDGLLITPFYLTRPLSPVPQPFFWNGIIKAFTHHSPLALLDLLQDIEYKAKRKRIIRNGPRTLDLDLLLYGNTIISLPQLEVPHPRMHERDFVLKPLSVIAPQVLHPLKKKTISQLLEGVKERTILHPIHHPLLFSWQDAQNTP